MLLPYCSGGDAESRVDNRLGADERSTAERTERRAGVKGENVRHVGSQRMPCLTGLECPPVIGHRYISLTQAEISSSGKGCLGQRVIRRRGKSVVEVSLNLGGKIPTLVLVSLYIYSQTGCKSCELEVRISIDIIVLVVKTDILRYIIKEVLGTGNTLTAVKGIVIPDEAVKFYLRC